MIREEMKVGPKGQVVIPSSLRKSMGVVPGSKVIFELRRDGVLLRKPRTDAVKIFERVAESGKPVKAKPEEYVEELEERST